MGPEIRFYFDYISSNAYLAWLRLQQIEAEFSACIELVPVLFAGLLEAHQQLGPAEIAPKARWMARNNLRKAAQLGVQLNPPRHHPFNPLLALRLSSLPRPDGERRDLVSLLFDAVWVSGVHLSDVAALEAFLAEAGHPTAALLEEAQHPTAKARLREQTDDAIAQGVFGVPTMVVGDDLFWGYDDLPFLELLLAGRDPLERADVESWMRPPRPSAMRRRFRTPEGA